MHSTEILAMPVHSHPFSNSSILDDEDSDDDYWGQYGDREDAPPPPKGSKDDDDDDIFSSESSPTSPLRTCFSTTAPWAPTLSSAVVVVDAHDEGSDDEYWQKYGDHDEDDDEDEE
ncbi:hypothetical protein BG006_000652, partial [Podila minutissima]